MPDPFFLLVFTALAYNGVVVVRNERLFRHRTRLIRAASEIARRQIDETGTFDPELFDQAVAPSWRTMLLKVWRSFDSFYPADSPLLAERRRAS